LICSQKYVRDLSAKFYDAFKVPANNVIPVEDVYERYGRELAFKLACDSGNQQCLTDTDIQDSLFAGHGQKIPKGMENVIFCSGLRGTDKKVEWTEMWKKMQITSDPTFKSQALSGLGCTDDTELLKDYLESTLGAGNSVNYTQAERRSVVSAVLNSHSGLEVVIEFFKDFDLDILRSFGYGSLEAMVTVPARTVKTREQQTLFSDFLLTLTQLDAEAYRRVSTIVGNNFVTQQQPNNAYITEIIGKIVSGQQEDTTTVQSQTTTDQRSTATNPTSQPTPTNTPSTNPTNPSTPSTPMTTESTTLGASSFGIKLITLITSFLVAMFLKH
jgi:ERAP1-like C-terminal domain